MATTVGDLCRLCAAKTTLVLGINIFENDGSIRQIRKKIEACLPLQVHQSDSLPKIICESCLYKLDMVFDFRERSLRTEKLLQDLVKELNEEKAQQNVVSVDQNNLIMLPQHHLIDGHMQNVDINLSHLSHRDDMLVGHNIILAHQHLDLNSHSLANLEISHHDLNSQDLHTTETILMDPSSHELHNSHFHNNGLGLIQQQHILQEQFNIRHELIDNIDLHNVNQSDVAIMEKEKDENFNDEKKMLNQLNYAQRNSSNDHLVNSSDNVKLESLSHHEDSNSNENPILIDNTTVNNVEKVYLLQDYDEVLERVNANSTECVYCNICGTGFSTKESFEEHYSMHFSKCLLCLAVFSTEEMLTDHLKNDHENPIDSNNQTLNQEEMKPIKTRLKRAVKESNEVLVDNDVDYESEIDASTLTKNNELEESTSTIERDDNESKLQRKKCTPKVCTECGKSYKTNYKLNEHMRKHTGEKPFKCKTCEKTFRSKIGLAQHEAKHTGQYEFSCPTCGKGFQCRSYLMVHQRVHSDIKPWPCATCGANFKTKQSLLDHTNRHLGVKPYMCDICGRGFITKGLCKTHQKIHTGLDNRKYSCKICNKMFVSKSYLQTHLKIHTGEKPFICEVCGKGFLTRVDLRIHSTLHTGEKSYVCEICGKAFARRDALRCHKRSHTGERPYSCEICGQTFTQFTPMAIHKRLHTGERPYSCEVCKKTFVSRSTMMTHAKKHNS